MDDIMKQALLIGGATLLAIATPAAAKPGNGHGQGQNHAYGYDDHGKGQLYGYGLGGCPPGLAKKGNGCRPPGQAKKLYNVGQHFPTGYGYAWNYNQIPYDLRTRYGLQPNGNYYYGDGYLYRVDPRTMLVQQAISALLYR